MDYNPITQRMVADLRKSQIASDERIQDVIVRLDEAAKLRNSDYKECEGLSKHAGKMSNRWRRLTALTVEGLVELDREILHEETECAHLKHSIEESSSQMQDLEQEVKSMENLVGLMRYFISRGEGGSVNNDLLPMELADHSHSI